MDADPRSVASRALYPDALRCIGTSPPLSLARNCPHGVSRCSAQFAQVGLHAKRAPLHDALYFLSLSPSLRPPPRGDKRSSRRHLTLHVRHETMTVVRQAPRLAQSSWQFLAAASQPQRAPLCFSIG